MFPPSQQRRRGVSAMEDYLCLAVALTARGRKGGNRVRWSGRGELRNARARGIGGLLMITCLLDDYFVSFL